MRRKALVTVLLLSVAGFACDDADPPRPKDGGTDARKDGGSDARDGASADRTPDGGMAVDAPAPDAAVPDKAPLPDSSVADKAADSPAPTPDTNPPDTAPPTPDTAPPTPDTSPDTAPPTPDTAPPTPDTTPPTPDTAIPDLAPDVTMPPDAQAFVPMNGCMAESDFDDVTNDPVTPLDWIIDNADPVCLKVKNGNLVRWVVDPMSTGLTFADHPVEQSPVDPTSKILLLYNAMNDDDYDVVFNGTNGTFGFRCANHPGIMRGAIWVVPSATTPPPP